MLGSKSMRRSEGRKRWCRTLALPPNRKMAFRGGALPLLSAPHESGKSLRQAVAQALRRRQPGRGHATGGGASCVVGRRCCCRCCCCSTVRVLCFFGLCYMLWRCHTHMPHLPHTLLNASLSECRVQWPRGKAPSNSRKQVNRASRQPGCPSRPGRPDSSQTSPLLSPCCPRPLHPALPIGNKGMNN